MPDFGECKTPVDGMGVNGRSFCRFSPGYGCLYAMGNKFRIQARWTFPSARRPWNSVYRSVPTIKNSTSPVYILEAGFLLIIHTRQARTIVCNVILIGVFEFQMDLSTCGLIMPVYPIQTG